MSRSISINSEIVSLKPQRASLTRLCRACLRSATACSSDASRIISVHLSLSGGSSKTISMAVFYPETGRCNFGGRSYMPGMQTLPSRAPQLSRPGGADRQSVGPLL